MEREKTTILTTKKDAKNNKFDWRISNFDYKV